MAFDMWAGRISWLLLTLSAAAAYFFENQTWTLALLMILLILPVGCGLMVLLAGDRIQGKLELPDVLERGTEGNLRLSLSNAGRLPVLVRGTLEIRNRMTGAAERLSLTGVIRGGGELVRSFALRTPHCGAVNISLRELRLPDPIGLFCRRAGLVLQDSFQVFPKLRPVEILLTETADFLSDSELYAPNCAGYDPSETLRIRDYVPGDPIRQIHWKLSEKLDKLQVRDFGLPIVEQMLLLVETVMQPGLPVNPDSTDRLLDLLYAVSSALTGQGIAHTIGWQDGDSSAYISRTVLCTEDVEAAIRELLDTPITIGEGSVCGSFSQNNLQCSFAHVVVFSCCLPPDPDLLFNGNRVTVLLPAPIEAETESWSQKAAVYSVSEETTELEL